MRCSISCGARSRSPTLTPAEGGGGGSLDATGVWVAVVPVAQPESAKPAAKTAITLKLDICKVRWPLLGVLVRRCARTRRSVLTTPRRH